MRELGSTNSLCIGLALGFDCWVQQNSFTSIIWGLPGMTRVVCALQSACAYGLLEELDMYRWANNTWENQGQGVLVKLNSPRTCVQWIYFGQNGLLLHTILLPSGFDL